MAHEKIKPVQKFPKRGGSITPLGAEKVPHSMQTAQAQTKTRKKCRFNK